MTNEDKKSFQKALELDTNILQRNIKESEELSGVEEKAKIIDTPIDFSIKSADVKINAITQAEREAEKARLLARQQYDKSNAEAELNAAKQKDLLELEARKKAIKGIGELPTDKSSWESFTKSTNNILDYNAGLEAIRINKDYAQQQNKLDLQYKFKQIEDNSNLFLKHIQEDIDNAEDFYKSSVEGYIQAATPHIKFAGQKYNEALEFAEGLKAENFYEVNETISDGFLYWRSGLRGTAHLGDTLLTLAGSALSFMGGDPKVVHSKFFETLSRKLGVGISKYDYMSQDASFWDKFGINYVLSKTIESMPETLYLLFPLGRLSTIGKRALVAEQASIAKGNITNGIMKSIDRQIKTLETYARNGNREAVSMLFGLKRLKIMSQKILDGKIPLDKLPESLGRLSKYYQEASRAGKAKKFPYVIATMEALRRSYDLAQGRGEGAKIQVEDLIYGSIHAMFDIASLGAITGMPSRFSQSIKNILEPPRPTSFVGGAIGSFFEEGLAEGFQTYIEQQAASNYTLPSLADIIIADKNSPYYHEKLRITEGAGIGAFAGVATHTGFSAVGGIVNNVIDNKIGDTSYNSGITTPLSGKDNITTDEYIEHMDEMLDLANERTGRDTTSESGAEADKKIRKQTKALKEEVEKAEEALDEKDKSNIFQLNNQSRIGQIDNKIEQLEQKNDELKQKQQTAPSVEQQKELEQNIERIEKLKKARDAYVKIDNHTKSVQIAAVASNAIEVTNMTEDEKNRANKAIQDLQENQLKDDDTTTSQEKYDNAIKALEDIVKPYYDKATLRSLLKLADSNDSDIKSVPDKIDEDNKIIDNKKEDKSKAPTQMAGTNAQPNANRQATQSTGTNQAQNNQQPSTNQAGNTQNANTAQQPNQTQQPNNQQTDNQDSDDTNNKNKKEKNISELTLEEIQSLNDEQDKETIARYLSQVSPEIALLAFAHSREYGRARSPELENLLENYSVVKLNYSKIESDEGNEIQSAKREHDFIQYQDAEFILVAKNFFNPLSGKREKINSSQKANNVISSSINSLSRNAFSEINKIINRIINKIENNQIEDINIDEELNQLETALRQLYQNTFNAQILLNGIIGANKKSPIVSYIRNISNRMAKDLDAMKNDYLALAEMLKSIENDDVYNKALKRLEDESKHSSNVILDPDINNIIDETNHSVSTAFTSLRNAIFKYKEAINKEDVSLMKKFKQKLIKALKSFVKITKKMVDIFSKPDITRMHDMTVALLQLEVNQLLGLEQSNNTIKVSGFEIPISQLVIFQNILFNPIFEKLNYKFNGHDAIKIVDSLLSAIFSNKTLDINSLSLLDTISPLFKNVKINLSTNKVQPRNLSGMASSSLEITSSEVSLEDLLVMNYETAKKLNEYFGLNEKDTVDPYEQAKYVERVENELHKRLNNKTDSLGKNIRKRLSIAMAGQTEIVNQIDNLFRIGIIANAFAITQAREENFIADENGNFSIEKENVLPQVTSFINKLFFDVLPDVTNKDDMISDIAELSFSIANTYLQNTQINGNRIFRFDGKKIIINVEFRDYIVNTFKRDLREWNKVLEQKEFESNDVNDVLEIFNTRFGKRIPYKTRRALMINLQNTGRVLNDNSIEILKELGIEFDYDKLVSIFNEKNNANGRVINADTYQAIKTHYLNTSEEARNKINENFIKYVEALENNTTVSQEVIESAMEHPNMYVRTNSHTIETQEVYNANGSKTYSEVREIKIEYVAITNKNSVSILNRKLFNNLKLNLGEEQLNETERYEIYNNAKDINSLKQLVETVESRLASYGDALVKLANAYENNPKNKIKEKDRKFNYYSARKYDPKTNTYKYSKIDFGKAVYSVMYMMPNGRSGRKTANTEIDNKVIREISTYVIPDEVVVGFDKDNKEIKVANEIKQQWKGVKNITEKELLEASDLTKSPITKRQKDIQDLYFGVLFSLARAFNIDFTKVELNQEANQKINKIIALKEKVKEKKREIEKLQKQQQNNNTTQKITNLNNEISNITQEIKELTDKLDLSAKTLDYKIKYKHNGKEYIILAKDLLNGLIAGNKDAISQLEKIAEYFRKNPEGIFDEHPGMSRNNRIEFLRAIKQMKRGARFVDAIQTQNLLVYMDGKATFSAENSARMRSLSLVDAFSNIVKSNSFNRDITLAQGFIQNQIILNQFKKVVEDFANKNNYYENFLEILADKGIDIYTASIGTTTNVFRALSNTNTLFSSMMSFGVIDRVFEKRILQPKAYGASNISFLNSIIEESKFMNMVFLGKIFKEFTSNPLVSDKINLLIKGNLSEEQRVETEYELSNAFKNLLNDISNGINTNVSLTEVEKSLLNGYINYFNNEIQNAYRFLFITNRNIFTGNSKSLIDYNNLYDNLYSEKVEGDTNLVNGFFHKEKERLEKYFNNFDIVVNERLTDKAIDIANDVAEAINKDNKLRNFFFELKDDWFKGNKHITFIIKDGKYTILEGSSEANYNISNEITKLMAKYDLKYEEVRELLINIFLFQKETNSLLFKHKPMFLRANAPLAIVEQNNAYLKEHKKYLDDKLFNGVKDCLLSIMSLVMNRPVPEDEISLNEFAKEFQTRYKNDAKFRKDFEKRKSEFLNDLKNNLLNSAWDKNDRDLFINFIKENPSLEQKQHLMEKAKESIEKAFKDLDNRISNIFMDKQVVSFANNEIVSQTFLKLTSIISGDVIGLWNHNFEAMLIIDMNNPYYQVYDAVGVNANQALEAIRTWSEGLGKRKGAGVDSAAIISDIDYYITTTVDSLRNGKENINKDNSAYGRAKYLSDKIINNISLDENQKREAIKDRLKFLRNLIRQLLQISEFANIGSFNISSILMDDTKLIQQGKGGNLKVLKQAIYEYMMYIDFLEKNKTNKNQYNDVIIEEQKNVSYTKLNTKDINVYDTIYNNFSFKDAESMHKAELNSKNTNTNIVDDELYNAINNNRNNFIKEAWRILSSSFKVKLSQFTSANVRANKIALDIVKTINNSINIFSNFTVLPQQTTRYISIRQLFVGKKINMDDSNMNAIIKNIVNLILAHTEGITPKGFNSIEDIVNSVLDNEARKIIRNEINTKHPTVSKENIDNFIKEITFQKMLNNSIKDNGNIIYSSESNLFGETITIDITNFVKKEQDLYKEILSNDEMQKLFNMEINAIQQDTNEANKLGMRVEFAYLVDNTLDYQNKLNAVTTIKSFEHNDDYYINGFSDIIKDIQNNQGTKLFTINVSNSWNQRVVNATNNIFGAITRIPLVNNSTNTNQQQSQNTAQQNGMITTNNQTMLDKFNFAIRDFLARNFSSNDFKKERIIRLFNNPSFEVSITQDMYNNIVSNNAEALSALNIVDSVYFDNNVSELEINGRALTFNENLANDYINKHSLFHSPAEYVDSSIDYSQAEEKTASEYKEDVNKDFDTMKEENPDIAEEIDFLQKTINGLFNQLLKLTRFFYSVAGFKGLGITIPRFNNTAIDVVIFKNKNLSTRIHEIWHAMTTYGFDALSNDAKYYVSRIQWLHGKVKAFLEYNPHMIKELGLVNDELGNRYDYIFNNAEQRGLEEFSATFLSEPKLIRFLSKNQEFKEFLKKETPKIEGKTLLSQLGNGLKQLAGYTYSLIMKRLTNEPESGFYVLASAMAGLSIHNNFYENKVNNKKTQEQKDYDSKTVVKANRVISNAFKFTTAKADRIIEARKASDPTFDAEKYKKEIREDLRKSIYNLDLKINSLVDKIDEAKTKREKIIATIEVGIALLQLTYYKNVKLSNLLTDKIKKDIVNDVLADMRQKLIENTIFDTKILLDFGITGTQYMSQFVNQVNRALGRKTSLNYHREIAMSNIKKEIQYILYKPDALSKYSSKNPEFLKQYSEGIAKLIIHNNLGDYFFGREINQNELDELANYIISYNENTNIAIKNKINNLLNEAFNRLNLNDNIDVKNSISKIISGMGYTRITDKRDIFGTQNIEQVLRDLDIKISDNYRKEIYGLFHQASTLEAILASRKLPADKSIQYYNSKIQPTRNFFEILNDKDYDEVKESIKDIITLHKKKTDSLYSRKVLRYKDEYVQQYIRGNTVDNLYYDDKMEEMYDEHTAFDYGTPDAYYDHSKKWYPYNQKITMVRLNPNKMDRAKYEEEVKNLKAKGFVENKDFISNDGTNIFVYSGWIDYNSSRQQGAFLHRALSHQGSIIQYLSDEDIEIGIKEIINKPEKQKRKQLMLEYGKNWTQDSILDLEDFYSKTPTRAFAGSETMSREQITNQMYEELAEVDTSIESSFAEMEKIIFENKIRHLNNDNLFNMIIESDKYIRNNRTLNSDGTQHHTVELFNIVSDNNGKHRVVFNKSILEKYGINLTRQDESDFNKMLIATGYLNSAIINGNILADTRLLSMMFGFELPSISQLTSKDGAIKKLYKAIETATRYLVKETRNNTIIRNPYLVFENFKSNLMGLAGEGVPVKDIAKTLPYYITELDKYFQLEKESIRLKNEIDIKSQQKYRDTKNISAEEQELEIKKLKNDLAIVINSLKTNPLKPLIDNGMYSNIVEDAETNDFKWDKKLIDLLQDKYNFKNNARNYVEEFFMTEDSDTYKSLAYLTRIGDFIPRAILYYHLIGKEGKSHKEALDIARDRFINYNTPLWSPTLRMLDRFGFVNYTKYAFAVERQIYKVFKKMPLNVPAIVGVQLGMESMGVGKISTLSSYFGESYLIDGKLPKGFLSGNFGMFFQNLYRWNYVTS